MAASYPASAKSFTPIVDASDYPQATHLNQAYDEITALEQALVSSGLEHNLFPESTGDARTLGTNTKYWGPAYIKAVSLLDASELTIASGAVVVTQGYHKIDTEADAASDDLDTLTATGLTAGFITVLRAENVARVVTLKDGTGNLLLAGDYAMSATDRTITLLFDGTNWRELARSVTATEGTWTPTLGGNTTYTTQTGTWTRKGREITVRCALTVNAIGTGSTSTISGLPANADGIYQGAVFMSSAAANFWSVVAETASGAGTVTFSIQSADDASMAGPANLFGNGTVVRFTLTYFV